MFPYTGQGGQYLAADHQRQCNCVCGGGGDMGVRGRRGGVALCS